MKMFTRKHIINNEKANEMMECTIIVHPSLLKAIQDRIAEVNKVGDCKITYITEFDLLDLKLADLVGKRIAICSTVPATEDIDISKKYEGMAFVLSKMKLPEFLEFGFKF